MRKVLIVDDEILVRNRLRSIINWEKHGYLICGEATNGQQALKLIREYEPEIVILDVTMPIMDGTVLSRHIAESFPAVKMIVLSSYDNYDYVRETLKNGAVDYLLKHRFDVAELLKVLKRAEAELKNEAYQREQTEKSELKRRQLAPLARQEILKSMLLGMDYQPDGLAPFDELFPSRTEDLMFGIVVMHIENWMLIANTDTERRKNQLIRSVSNFTQQIMDELGGGIIAYLENGRFALALPFPKTPSIAKFHDLSCQVMNRIVNTLQRYLNLVIVWGVGPPCYRPEEFAHSYQKAVKAVDGLPATAPAPDSPGPTATLSIHQEKTLLAALECLDQNEVTAIIGQVFTQLSSRHSDCLSVQMAVNELISIASKACAKYGADFQSIISGCSFEREQLSPGTNLEEINTAIVMIYTRLINALKESRAAGNYSKHIQEAIRYIHDHYQNDLSLNEIGDKIGITPSYLSRLFKEEIGMSFVEYLNDFRVQIAKKYIINGESTIKNLYKKVGFNSYNYFFKVFKELTGYTPLDYAKHHSKILKK